MRGGVALAVLVFLAGCQKSFDDRYADAQKKVNEQAASIDQELATKASEAAMGEGDAEEQICPDVTRGWLESAASADLAVIWLLQVRKDGTLRWGEQPLARNDLVARLRKAQGDSAPHPVLFVRLEKGVDCNGLQSIKNEVIQAFGCDDHRCLIPPPEPKKAT